MSPGDSQRSPTRSQSVRLPQGKSNEPIQTRQQTADQRYGATSDRNPGLLKKTATSRKLERAVRHTRHASLETGGDHLQRPGFRTERSYDLGHGREETLESQKDIPHQ